MLRFGLFCLDFGHIAWIWAFWQNQGQNRPEGDKALRMGQGGTNGRTGGRTDGQIPPEFYRTSSPLGPLPCFLSLQLKIMQSRATGIADHILPLGDLLPIIPGQKNANVPSILQCINTQHLISSHEKGELVLDSQTTVVDELILRYLKVHIQIPL